MRSFATLFIRCLLALVLVANGALAHAHAHAHAHAMGGELSAAKTVATEMPCHAGGEQVAPAPEHPAPSGPDGCCGTHCVCGCVFASVLPTLARLALIDALDREIAPAVTQALAAQQPACLLRPPIA